ncbi:MAG TPA: HEAT repeat domain-containing protein [Pirellulales bacterium]|nr:HEAT repeat domain-containing protein [Pirellulales bacterium]
MVAGLAVALACSTLLICSTGALADDEPNDQLVKLVIGLVEDKDKDVRALGLEQVRTAAKGPGATRQFAALLPKLSTEAQAALLRALADRGDAAALPTVRDVLKSIADEAVRVAAIAALGSLGNEGDVRCLLNLLGAAAPAEREAARAGLIRLSGPKVAAEIATALAQAHAKPAESNTAKPAESNTAKPAADDTAQSATGDESPLRVTLIEILAARRALDTLPAMLAAATDDDAAVRAAAMTALGQLAAPEQIPGMVQAVLRAEPGPERVAAEKAIMFVCRRADDPEKRAEPLLAAIDPLNAAQRTTMLPALGRVGGAAALAVIEAAIASPDADLHATGIRALCNWPDAAIAPRLIELVHDDQHPEHGTLALGALIRVAPLPDERSPQARLELLMQVLALCTNDAQRNQVLNRAQAVRTVETLRFLMPYVDQPDFAQQACESIVELAHHRELRDANKPEFHAALDKVIQTSQDPIVVERANRYKNGQTWVRPKRK